MKNKINILFVIDGLAGGGKERQLVEILKNIDKSRFELGVVTFNKNQHYTQQVTQLADYFKYIEKQSNKLKPLTAIWQVYQEFKPNIVHTWDSLSSFYSYLPSKYFKAIIIDGSIRDAGVDKGWNYHFKRFFLKRATLIISNSFAGLSAYKVEGTVLYNAIDTSRFLTPSQNPEFNLIMTANFSSYKDQQTFLNAAIALVYDQFVDNVYLLGDGPYLKTYMNWVDKEYPDIAHKFYFAGSVANVEEYLSNCKIGVLCSTPEYSEGLSNAVLEYMAAGLIPIVTNLGGSSEIIEDEINGYLIEPKDHSKIIELVCWLKNDPGIMKTLKSNAKNTILEKFSIQNTSRDLSSIYESLV